MAYYIYMTMHVPDLAFKQEGQFLKSEDIHQHIQSGSLIVNPLGTKNLVHNIETSY